MPGLRSGKLGSQGRGLNAPRKFSVTLENIETGKRTKRMLTEKQFNEFKSKTLRVVGWSGADVLNKDELSTHRFGSPTKFLVTFENVKTGKITRKTLTKKQFDDFRSKTLRVVAWSGV